MGYPDRGERAGKVVRCLECDVCCCCGKKLWSGNRMTCQTPQSGLLLLGQSRGGLERELLNYSIIYTDYCYAV